MGTSHHKLSAAERDEIGYRRARGQGLRTIARKLGRSVSTISEELKRNRFQSRYLAVHAQAVATGRKQAAGRRPLLKNDWLYSYVTTRLRDGWSPEEIVGRLALRCPDEPGRRIGVETIYRFIYRSDQADERWWEYLPRKHRKRRKRHGRKHHRSRIPDRVSIRERPPGVNKRAEFGHWEGDTLEGMARRDSLHTEAERVSRKLMAGRVARIASPETARAQKHLFGALPPAARRSTTLDNGRANHEHTRLREIGMDTYFADPYSAWQRGTGEYHNGLLRRYFPKGTDFATVSDEELADVVAEINDRPRKCLGYYTPNEVFAAKLNSTHPQCSD